MKARIDWNGDTLIVDFSQGRSLGIELVPGGTNPAFFTDASVKTRPLALGGFVGDMKQGGSCNAEVIEFSPHSHGTHTECVGHISPEHQNVVSTIHQLPTLLRIVTIGSESLDDRSLIQPAALNGIEHFDGGALAIRTLPNDESKKQRNYDREPDFPVLSAEAMKILGQSALLHLLVDTPSVDRSDSADLENHKRWWGMNTDTAPGVPDASKRSITEMIFIPDEIQDGEYWLELQLPPLVSDAVPSRPMIYPVKRKLAS